MAQGQEQRRNVRFLVACFFCSYALFDGNFKRTKADQVWNYVHLVLVGLFFSPCLVCLGFLVVALWMGSVVWLLSTIKLKLEIELWRYGLSLYFNSSSSKWQLLDFKRVNLIANLLFRDLTKYYCSRSMLYFCLTVIRSRCSASLIEDSRSWLLLNGERGGGNLHFCVFRTSVWKCLLFSIGMMQLLTCLRVLVLATVLLPLYWALVIDTIVTSWWKMMDK